MTDKSVILNKLNKGQNIINLAPPEGVQGSLFSNRELYYCAPSKVAKFEKIELTTNELLDELAEIIVSDYFNKINKI